MLVALRAVLDSAARAAPDVANTDRALAELEACPGLPPGFVRALRAERWPECAEHLAAPLLRRPPGGLDPSVRETLRGLLVASRIARWDPRVTPIQSDATPKNLDHFVTGTLSPTLERMQRELHALEEDVLALAPGSYGRARAQVALSSAWLKAQTAYRRAPIPAAIKVDYDQRTAYYTFVDAVSRALTNSARGRHAAALQAMSAHGVTHEDSVIEWLSALWNDATFWQYLALPPSADGAKPGVAGDAPVVASQGSPWVVGHVVPLAAARDLTFWSERSRGLPWPHRQALTTWLATPEGQAAPSAPALHLELARRQLQLALLYRLRQPLERALLELDSSTPGAEADLLRALATTLLSLPETPQGWLEAPHDAPIDTTPLDALLDRTPRLPEPLLPLALYDQLLFQRHSAQGQRYFELGVVARGLAETTPRSPYTSCIRRLSVSCQVGSGMFRKPDTAPPRPDCSCPLWPWR